jgi:hypothetical protein
MDHPVPAQHLLAPGAPWRPRAAAEVHQQHALRPQHPHGLVHRGPPVGDQVEHVAGQDRAERGRGQRQPGHVGLQQRERLQPPGVGHQPPEHGRGHVDADQGNPARFQRQRDPARSHADLQARAAPGELGR